MKRWIRWAARLYPPDWRLRYGGEFDALLDAAGLQWSDVADVFRGAVKMRMTAMMSYKKTALLAGLAGAVIAGGIAFSIHDVWACNATLVLQNPAAESASGLSHRELLQQVLQMTTEILSRDNLIALINNPQFDLYPKERERYPVQQIAENTMRRQLHVVPFGTGDGRDQAFQISFQYPDRVKALAVVQELVFEFHARSRSVGILEKPQRPEFPTYPVRSSIILIGLLAGMLTGMLALAIWRRTRQYAVVTMSLPKEDKQFIDSQVAAGSYRNADEYIRALIRAEGARHK